MPRFDVMVLTPPGSPDPGLAIAAHRAGAQGFLDLELATDHLPARQALQTLRRFSNGSFGVKVGDDDTILSLVLDERPASVLLSADHPDLAARVTACRRADVRVIGEAVNVAEGERAERLGVDAVVLKGHEAGGRVSNASSFLLLQQWRKCHPRSTLPVWVQGGIGPHTAAACVIAGAAGVVLDGQVLLARESPLPDPFRRRLEVFDGSETVVVDGRRRYSQVGEADVWFLGQDAALAKPLADRFVTVGGIIAALRESVADHLEAAARLKPLAEDSPLAASHRTRFPIVQGPMTRVSDTAAFADAVADAGALPFLALALLREAEAVRLLEETKDRLGDRSWGVGILGFAPPEIRSEQMKAILAVRPPFALIAGGRPDQARSLEKEGIPTYLHVPSPGLLRLFLADGARRFVFEGRECGGHVGPRTSFVLWETMTAILEEHAEKVEGLHVLFAGGIHDGLSAAMVSALSATLARRGVAVGVLIGTAYLFTHEAVSSGAIVPRFQREALHCRDTVLLETGPGHAIRCVPTPYAETFEDEKRRLKSDGRDADAVRESLETMNVGRLRVASKGLDRATPLPEDEQFARGMYMIGQVAALRDSVVSMAELHADVSTEGTRLLQPFSTPRPPAPPTPAKPSDIAIIGMSCFMPKAGSLREFWSNVLRSVDAVTEVPPDRWDWHCYYGPDAEGDTITSKWGGFLDDVPFDPLRYGIPPNSLRSIEPVQLLLLEAVRHALDDAGYANRPFDRERTAVILGAGGGAAQLAQGYSFRSYLPLLDGVPGMPVTGAEVIKRFGDRLPEWTEDTFPGILLNVAAGRVANRFNLGGPNFAVDAACGSSLAALYVGVRELETGGSDVALVMGADTVQNPFTYLLFSKTHAFSTRGRCRTFDESADGIVISEGVGVVVLKRLADAERDGDRIYAVIKGVGASSDGRDKGLTAPRPEGQLRALRRAYAKAGVSPAAVGLVEAHGTGTAVGDRTEVESLAALFRESDAAPQQCVVGSVKSMIGHTKCAAGIAGLISATMAIHHKVLPPTPVETPNAKADFERSPFHLNREPTPWVHGGEQPRSAGVSAFGFGGTNYHAVLQEYTGDFLDAAPGFDDWPAELHVWRRPTRQELLADITSGAGFQPAGLGWQAGGLPHGPTLAVVAESSDDLQQKLKLAAEILRSDKSRHDDPRGVFFAENPTEESGKIAFLFPGQGSQYPGMLAQVAMAFPEARQVFDDAEHVLAGRLARPLGKLIFPPSSFTPETEKRAREQLTATEVAQPAVGAASLAMVRVLAMLGVEPDLLAGHSYGEYVALCAAGAMTPEELIALSHRRGEVIAEAARLHPGAMAAVEGDVTDLEGVTVANFNGPRQTVISGSNEAVERALVRCHERGLRAVRLPVAAAFHSPLMTQAREPLRRALDDVCFRPPTKPVFSNTTGEPYTHDTIASVLADHLTSPVRFQAEVEGLYRAGARIFIEVGPQSVLTNLVGQTLGNRPHLAVPCDVQGRPGLVQLQRTLAQLITHGVTVNLERLHRRSPRQESPPGPGTWLVNGSRVRPLDGPEPCVLGQSTMNGKDQPAPLPEFSANGVAQPPRAQIGSDDTARVMLRYQDMMQTFVEAQKQVMLSYLQSGGRAPGSLPPLPDVKPPRFVTAVPNHRPPEPPKPPPPPPPPQRNGKLDRDGLTNRLFEIVSKRTGYPKEMIGLDQHLEADLGIDSIKRVEILAGLAQELDGVAAQVEMEKLTGLKTLRGIIDQLGALIGAVKQETPPRPFDGGGVRRMLVRPVAAPTSANTGPLPGGTILVTDDGRGVALALAARLRAAGQIAVVIDAVPETLPALRAEHGNLAGLIHLTPLARPPKDETASDRMRREVRSLFLLARELGEDLGRVESPVFLAATAMGGTFGVGDIPETFFPGQGGVAGLVKCLAHEWPGALARVVDLDPTEPPESLAEALFGELGRRDGLAEVGYRRGQRVTLECVAAPSHGREAIAIPPGGTILVTGGARGITAAVALRLARRHRLNFVLVGTSPLPDPTEPDDTRLLTDEGETKAVLAERLRREGRQPAPSLIEAAFQRLKRDREIRATLSALKSTGATVDYRPVDVRDRAAFAALVDEVEFDGVIHGAGVIHDKLVGDKTPESWDRVFETKVESALVLAERLRPERLKFCVFFASVAGRFGNRGQCDYAAANEVLSKLATQLDHRWPGRVVSVVWGPWSGLGMVADIEGHLRGRGLELIPPEAGTRLFEEELLLGQKGESEVVIAGDVEQLARRPGESSFPNPGHSTSRLAR